MDPAAGDSHEYLFKLLCIGESNVGKTTFLHQYINDTFANFRSTVGVDVFEKRVTGKNDQRVLLQLWDTAGQVRLSSRATARISSVVCSGTVSQFDQIALS